MSENTRRAFIQTAVSLIASPAIVRASSLMPIHAWVDDFPARSVWYPVMCSGSQDKFDALLANMRRYRERMAADILTNLYSDA